MKTRCLLLILACATLLSACGNDVSDRVIHKYFEEKYQIDVEVIAREEWNTGNMGELTHEVRLIDNQNVIFNVYVTDDQVTGDNYPVAVMTYEEYKKFEKVFKDVEQLGYELQGKKNLDFLEVYGSDQVKLFLDLYTSEKIDYVTFEEQHLDRYVQLVELIRSSGADIHLVNVDEKKQDGNFISIPMKELPKIMNRDDLYLKIKQRNLGMVSTIENEKATQVTSKLDTKRFEFTDPYFSNWLKCGETNEETECKWYFVNVQYEKGGLNLTNDHLKGDITYIYEFLSDYLNNKPFNLSVNEPMIDGDDFATINIEYEEWQHYEDIQQLLEAKLNN